MGLSRTNVILLALLGFLVGMNLTLIILFLKFIAQPPKPPFLPPEHKKPLPGLLHELDLNPHQRKRWLTLQPIIMDSIHTLTQKIHENRLKIIENIDNETLVDSLIQKINKYERAIEELRVTLVKKLNLNPHQRRKLNRFLRRKP